MKITKPIRKRIRDIAESLPPIRETVTVYVTGKEIMEQEKYRYWRDKFMENGGINPDDKYKSKEASRAVNHFARLSKAYEAQGIKGIEKYVAGINSKFKLKIDEKTNEQTT